LGRDCHEEAASWRGHLSKKPSANRAAGSERLVIARRAPVRDAVAERSQPAKSPFRMRGLAMRTGIDHSTISAAGGAATAILQRGSRQHTDWCYRLGFRLAREWERYRPEHGQECTEGSEHRLALVPEQAADGGVVHAAAKGEHAHRHPAGSHLIAQPTGEVPLEDAAWYHDGVWWLCPRPAN
jgi:hypothetical protein